MRLKTNKTHTGTRASSITAARRGQGTELWLRGKAFVRQSWPFLCVFFLVVWLFLWAIAGGMFGLIGEKISDRAAHITARHGFVVETVTINGRHYTQADNVTAALAITRGQPLFSVDLQGIKDRLSELEWVETATIRRHWPDRISVMLRERQPLAIWYGEGTDQPYLLDRSGTVMMVDIPKAFQQLLRVSGSGAPLALPDFVTLLLAEPKIAAYVKKVERISERRWDMILVNGTRVKLPEDDIGYALSRLRQSHQDKQTLDEGFVEIDLRLNDRMIVSDE